MQFVSARIKRHLLTPFLDLCAAERGNILVYIVMMMVIFGLLGALMVSLFSTSISSSATANESRRANYLAEAGLRYGMSELRNQGFSDSVIDPLNQTIFNLQPSGEFDLNIFSNWFESASDQSIAGSGSGTISVDIPKGEIPQGIWSTTPANLFLVQCNYIDRSNPQSMQNPQDSARAFITGFIFDPMNQTSLSIQVSDDGLQGFVPDNNSQLCFAVQPESDQLILPFTNLRVNAAARDFFPKTDGVIEVNRRPLLYRSAVDRGSYVELNDITFAGWDPLFAAPQEQVRQASDYIILAPRNYVVLSKGQSGNVTFGGDMAHSVAVARLSPGGYAPDFGPDNLNYSDTGDFQQTESDTNFIRLNEADKSITIGEGNGNRLGSVFFRDTRNIGGVREFCNGGACFFDRGIRVFFTLEYTGSGDGLIFSLINGNGDKNDTASVGGDIDQSELLGFSGDSRLNSTGTLFLDNSGPQKGLIPPKIGLEFDTKINYSSTLEQSLKYCSGSNLNADTRNDPGSNGRDAVQYVFWGKNPPLDVPCRKEPFCGGVSTCKGDPSYDDNRHDAVGDGTQNWSKSTGGNIESSPAVAGDGTIYVGSWDGRLYAINPDGSFKWAFDTGGKVYSPTVASSGTIYVGSADGNLYALNPNGSLRWSYSTGAAVRTKPAVSSSGMIFFGSDDGSFYALLANGSFAWSFDTFAPVQSSPALSNSGNVVYFGSDSGTFYGLTVASGLIFGTIAPFAAFKSSPAVGLDGTIYVGSDNGRIYAFNSALSSILWSVNTGEAVRSSPAVGSDGTVYVGSMNDYLYALDTTNGAEKWKFQAGSNVQSPIAIDGNNHIYFGSDDNKVHALYADGSEKWSFTTGGDVRGKPLVMADGTVYAGSYDFRLYAINQFANPKNYRDRLITYSSGSVGGVPVSVDNTDDWLKGAAAKGPWAVRMELTRSQYPDADNYYPYELKTWLRQCNTSGCSGENDPVGTFYEDTRINYSPNTPTARPAQLVQTIKLSSAEHQDFDRFIFGFTSQTGAGDLQTATISKFQLSFIRPGDPTVTNDPNWP